jgi:acyl carrier protein
MTKDEFLRELERQLEIPEGSIKEHQSLPEIEAWDSMAAVLFMALADEKLNVAVSGNQIAAAKTVSDLLALLGARVAG